MGGLPFEGLTEMTFRLIWKRAFGSGGRGCRSRARAGRAPYLMDTIGAEALALLSGDPEAVLIFAILRVIWKPNFGLTRSCEAIQLS